MIKQIVKQDMIDTVEQLRPLSVKDRDTYATVPGSYDALKAAADQNAPVIRSNQPAIGKLPDHFSSDKVVLIGETASSTTDLINTPLGQTIPGVVAHGVVVNAILTRTT